jgi:DNA-binding NarL/FixJ family response regulator
MSFQPLRVLIIDDHARFRAAARELLERRGFAVVAEADGATTGLEAAETVTPDAVGSTSICAMATASTSAAR